MARTETAVFTNMCMICDGDRVLVQDRRNPDWPGITFPGGHVEPGEAFLASVIREVREETGLTVRDLQLCGVKQILYPDNRYRYVVLMYRTDRFTGELRASDEGRVFWVPRRELTKYRMAKGFETMLEVFEDPRRTENLVREVDGHWTWENL